MDIWIENFIKDFFNMKFWPFFFKDLHIGLLHDHDIWKRIFTYNILMIKSEQN